MAGARGIVLGRYLLIATTSALAWALAWTGAGYALGNVTGQIAMPFGFVTTLGLLVGAILAVCLVLKHRRRHVIVARAAHGARGRRLRGRVRLPPPRNLGALWLADADRGHRLAGRARVVPARHRARPRYFIVAWPARSPWPPWTLIPYLLLADLENTILAAILTFSDRVIYPAYATIPLA